MALLVYLMCCLMALLFASTICLEFVEHARGYTKRVLYLSIPWLLERFRFFCAIFLKSYRVMSPSFCTRTSRWFEMGWLFWRKHNEVFLDCIHEDQIVWQIVQTIQSSEGCIVSVVRIVSLSSATPYFRPESFLPLKHVCWLIRRVCFSFPEWADL